MKFSPQKKNQEETERKKKHTPSTFLFLVFCGAFSCRRAAHVASVAALVAFPPPPLLHHGLGARGAGDPWVTAGRRRRPWG